MSIKRDLRRKQHGMLNPLRQVIHAARVLRKDEKILHKIRKKMIKKFHEGVIDKIRKKCKGDNNKYAEKVGVVAKDFYGTSEQLMQVYTTVFTILKNITLYFERLEYKDLQTSHEVLNQAVQTRQHLVFTEKEIKEVNHSFKSLYKYEDKQESKEKRNDKRIAHGHKPKHLGRLGVHKNNPWLAKDIRKAEKKLGEESGVFSELQKRIADELQNGAKADLGQMLKEYAEEFDLIERTIHRVKKDIMILIEHHLHEHNKETEKWIHFHGLLGEGYSHHISDNLKKLMDQFYGSEENNSLIREITEFYNKEKKAERYIIEALHGDEHIFDVFMNRLKGDKEKLLKHAYQ